MSVKEYEGSLEGDENILKSDHDNDCTTFYIDENHWIIYFKRLKFMAYELLKLKYNQHINRLPEAQLVRWIWKKKKGIYFYGHLIDGNFIMFSSIAMMMSTNSATNLIYS